MYDLTYIITNYLYISKNIFIETQRMTEKYFKKQNLSLEWNEYFEYFSDKSKLFDYMVENKLNYQYENHINYSYYSCCPNCGSNTEFKSLKWGYKKYCSRRCASLFTLNLEKYKQTMIEKYGVENSFMLPAAREKAYSKESQEKKRNSTIKTNMERYGVPYTLSLKEFRGDDNRNYKDIVQKVKNTCLERYGVDWNLNIPSVKETRIQKTKITNLKNGRYLPIEERDPFAVYVNAAAFKHGFSFTKYTTDEEKELLSKYGVFNNRTNTKGCVRDHLLSRRYGFENNIPTWIISHPANCEIVLNSENTKRSNCKDRSDNLITLEELLYRIENYSI